MSQTNPTHTTITLYAPDVAKMMEDLVAGLAPDQALKQLHEKRASFWRKLTVQQIAGAVIEANAPEQLRQQGHDNLAAALESECVRLHASPTTQALQSETPSGASALRMMPPGNSGSSTVAILTA